MSYPCPHCGIDTALAFPGPADEVVIDGKRWRVIPSGFGYDDGSQSARLIEVAEQCRHAVYNHGCPSCDRQDPEDR